MNEPLMIGTRGWTRAAPGDEFYPPELPDDWRFCHYSNNLRSVLVPQELWPATTRTDVEQWLADSDPAFRFVLELPAALSVPLAHARRERAVEEFLETVEPLAARTAGLVLRIAADAPFFPDWFEHLLHQLTGIAPLSADLPDGAWRSGAVYAALERQAAGLVWHCARDAEPRPGGRLRLALAPPAPPAPPRPRRRRGSSPSSWGCEACLESLTKRH